jgi:hypothetical protein
MDCWEEHNPNAKRMGEDAADGEVPAAERHTTLQSENGYTPSKGFEVVRIVRTKTIRTGSHQ